MPFRTEGEQVDGSFVLQGNAYLLALQREFMQPLLPSLGVRGGSAGVAAAGFAQPRAEVGVAPAAAGQDLAQDPGDLGPGHGWR